MKLSPDSQAGTQPHGTHSHVQDGSGLTGAEILALAGNSALQLLATTLRKERRSRSAPAQSVVQDLRTRPLCSNCEN